MTGADRQFRDALAVRDRVVAAAEARAIAREAARAADVARRGLLVALVGGGIADPKVAALVRSAEDILGTTAEAVRRLEDIVVDLMRGEVTA